MHTTSEKYLTLGFALIAFTFVGVSWFSQGQSEESLKSSDGSLRAESAPLVGDAQYGEVALYRASEDTERSFAQKVFSRFGLDSKSTQVQEVALDTPKQTVTPQEEKVENVIVAHGTIEDVDAGFSINTFLDKWREDREEKEEKEEKKKKEKEQEEQEEEEEKEDEQREQERNQIASAKFSVENKLSSRTENEPKNIQSREILMENASRRGSFGQVIVKSNSTSTKLKPIDIYAEDAIQRRMLDELQAIQVWAQGERMIFSEVGVDNAGDEAKYIALLNKYFEAANPMGLSIMGWAVGDWWGDYNVSLSLGSQISTSGVSGPFVKNQSTDRYVRGLNLAGAEFGMGSNGEGNVGALNVEYTYHAGSNMWRTMKDRGFTHARYPFRLERLFNNDGSFNEADKRLMLEGLGSARAVGMKVLLDPHNYGTLQMGGSSNVLGRSAFTQEIYNTMMRNLAQLAKENADVVDMIGLMNEPKNLDPADWERQSQSALSAIRAQGFKGVIEVPTGYWQGVQDAPTIHPNGPWINDPLDNIMYGLHQYFDRNHSGSYQNSYAQDERDLRQYYSPGNVRVYGLQ